MNIDHWLLLLIKFLEISGTNSIEYRKMRGKPITHERKANHPRIHLVVLSTRHSLCEKCPYSDFSGLYFPAFGLNTQRYEESLRIQSKCGKIRTRETLNKDTFHAVTKIKNSANDVVSEVVLVFLLLNLNISDLQL